jgi:hypothetical protein
MAYNITLTDGTAFATIADGTINTDSSVTLVGKNYAGYGIFLDENFIQMLENFSDNTAPPTPLTGQIWWDSGNSLLKVYNGTIWKTISAATASGTAPTSNVIGDLWYDTTNQQLKVWTGSSFIVVGPAFTSSEGTAGAIPESINDIGSTPHFVTSLYVNSNRVAIVSYDSVFTPQSPISTWFPRIYPGITANIAIGGSFSGNLISLGNITASAGGTSNVAVLSALGVGVTGIVSASGNITGGNITTGGTATVTGNVTGGNLAIGGLATITGNITGGNITTGGSITATGTGNITGNVNGGNLRTTGLITATGTVTGGNVASGGFITAGSTVSSVGNITSAANVAGANVIASVNVSAVGNVAGTYFIGNGSQLTGISAAVSVSKIESGLSNVQIASANANITMAVSTTANVVVVSQNGLSITTQSANATSPGTSGLSTAYIEHLGSNAVGNIGSSASYFNRIFATATTALYADVAERFESDELLDPGTVVELGGSKEITRSRVELSENVFGVISTRPAFTMNGGAGEDDTHPAVAMTGRVPVKVTGIINKGDRLVSAGDGIARAAQPGEATSFNVIGRSLVSKSTNDLGTVEAIVNIQI